MFPEQGTTSPAENATNDNDTYGEGDCVSYCLEKYNNICLIKGTRWDLKGILS